MTSPRDYPGLLASGTAVLVVALLYLSGVAALFGPARPLYVAVVAAVAGGGVAGAHTDLLRVGFPPGFLALLATTLVFEPAAIPSLAAVVAVLQYLLPVAVLAGCVSALVAVVLDHHVLDGEGSGGSGDAADDSDGGRDSVVDE